MGCGGSTASAATPASEKYNVEKDKTPAADAKGRPRPGGLAAASSPPEEDVTPQVVFNGSVHYACFKTRLSARLVQANGTNFAELQRLATGVVGLERTPLHVEGLQPDTPCIPVRIAPDFCSRFAMLVPEPEVDRLFSQTEAASPRMMNSPSGELDNAPVSPNNTGLSVKKKRKVARQADRRRMEGAVGAAVQILVPKMVPLVIMAINVRPVGGLSKGISSITLSSDEKVLAVTSLVMQDLAPRAAQLNAQTKRQLTDSQREKLAFIPCALNNTGDVTQYKKYESKPFLARRQYTVRTFDVRQGSLISVFTDKNPDIDPQVNSISFTFENQQVVTCGAVVDVWDVSRRRKSKSLELPPGAGVATSMCVSPCGKLIAAGIDLHEEMQGWVTVWRESKLLHTFTEQEAPITSVAFSPDSTLIASGDRRGIVLIWAAQDGTVKATLPRAHPMPVHTLQFPEMGRLFAADYTVLRCWKLQRSADKPSGAAGDSEAESDEKLTPKATPKSSKATPRAGKEAKSPREKPDLFKLDASLQWSRHVGQPEPTADPELPVYEDSSISPRGGLRFRSIVRGPAGSIFVLQTQREVCIPFPLRPCTSSQCLLLHQSDGTTLETIHTKAPISCVAAGCTTAVAGDLWGNIYVIDFVMKNALPSFT